MHTLRINIAEAIVWLAKLVMPGNYMLEGERAAGHLVINGIGMRLEEAGIGEDETLDDVIDFYKKHHADR